MFYNKKVQGAVSIFLVIILVPMMTVAALFTDAGKIKVAKASAAAAGDLALNTALTGYDTELKELYGLMATAQNTEDLYSRLEGYFKTCITSTGTSEDEADYYIKSIINSIRGVEKSGDVSDILNIKLTDFTVKKEQALTLENASVMKKQIVDFMKYRGPINTGLDFLSALKSFSTLSKQTDLVDKKQEYYKNQQTLMESLHSAWGYIAQYNQAEIAKNPEDYYSKLNADFEIIEKGANNGPEHVYGYNEISKYAIMALYGTNNYFGKDSTYNCKITKEAYVSYKTPTGNSSEDEAYAFSYQGKQNNFADYCKNYSLSKLPTLEQIKNAIKDLYTNLDRISKLPDFIHSNTNHYDIQVYVQNSRKHDLQQYSVWARNAYQYYNQLKAMMIWIDGYDMVSDESEDESESGNENKPSAADILNTQIKVDTKTKTVQEWFSELEQRYNKAMDSFAPIGLDNSTVWEKAHKEWEERSSYVGAYIAEHQGTVKKYVSELEKASEKLGYAINDLGYALKQLNGNLATAKSNWSTAANDKAIKDTSMAKQDKAEIDQLDKTINSDNITKLKNRLSNIKEKIDNLVQEIKKYKYCDIFIGDILYCSDEYEDGDIIRALRKKWGDNELYKIGYKTNECESFASNMWGKSWESGNLKNDGWTKQSGSQPKLTLDQLALYTYLQTKFGNEPVTDCTPKTKEQDKTADNGKKQLDDIKKNAETASSKVNPEQTDSSNNTNNGENKKQEKDITQHSDYTGGLLPSKKANVNTQVPGSDESNYDVEGAAGNASGSLSSLFGDGFLDAVKSAAEGLRDDLYISDYILSMMSYDTIEKEYKKSNPDAKTINLTTLTNNDISEKNNYDYKSEVEYVLYGEGNTSNKLKSYGTIFAIRFGFNLIYAFATSEVRESALAIATPISAATLGIIPVPLIQGIVIIAIACCESALDVASLRDGNKVPLYKTSETWTCSISGLVKNVVMPAAKEVVNRVVDKGVEELNGLLDMADSELTDMIRKSESEITGQLNSTYDKLVTENAERAIEQLTSLTRSAVDKIMSIPEDNRGAEKQNLISEIKSELKKWKDQQTGDSMAAKIKRAAADVVLNNDSLIQELFDAMKNGILSSKPTVEITETINDMGETVYSVGGAIMDKIEAVKKKIINEVQHGTQFVIDEKEKFVNEIKKSAESGANNLKSTINSKIDSFCGTGDSQDAATGKASLFSFAYSDYLRLFLVIGLIGDESETAILKRTADIIQINMQQTGHSGFKMANSGVYVSIEAEMLVKPTLIALPIFAETAKEINGKSNWYSIKYSGIMGY